VTAPVFPTVTPATAPAVTEPAPTTKEGRLKALLNDYMADKITPSEYQSRRAKILAEP